jgi:hypothetical protein
MCANTRWEMHLKAYGDRLSRTKRVLAALGNSSNHFKGLSHQFEFGKKWYGRKDKNR